MKTILYFVFSFFIIVSTLSFAQENYFSVLVEQGKISLLKNSEDGWKGIQTGSKIFPGEKLKTGSGSYLALVYSNGNSLEINKKGIYDFSRLKNLIKDRFKSAGKKFAEYIISEIRKKEDDAGDMKSLGAVVREKPNYIASGIPFSTLAIDSVLVIKWYPYAGFNSYNFKLINNKNITIYMKELYDTLIKLPINQLHLNKGEIYKWEVSTLNDHAVCSDTNYITIPSSDKSKKLKNSITELKEQFSDKNSALNNMILASFYQDNQLNIKAFNAYKRAVELEPEVKMYKKMFANFLFKMKLDRMIEHNGKNG